MARRSIMRRHCLESSNYDKWKSIMDMSDAEFEAYEIIGNKVPEKYIVTNPVQIAQLLKKDEEFVIKIKQKISKII